MALTKKTTIRLSPALYEHLARIAGARDTSLGELVCAACVARYGDASQPQRVAAAEALRALSLPVSDVRTMKRESIAEADELNA